MRSDTTSLFEMAAREERGLTQRQRQILDLIERGHTNREIADALDMSLDGAKWNVSEILTKLGLSTREEAAEFWRWRRGQPLLWMRRAMRGLVGLPALKWGAVAAASLAVTAIAVRVYGGSSTENPADVQPFYLEAREFHESTESTGSVFRWWYQDAAHYREEFDHLLPPGQGRSAVEVGDGQRLWGYDSVYGYSSSALEPLLPHQRVRPTPTILIGPAPADTMDGVIEAFSRWDDGTVPARRVGHDRVLGRDVEVIEYVRGTIWVDPRTMTILKHVSEPYTVEVTVFERTRPPADKLVLDVPPDVTPVVYPTPSGTPPSWRPPLGDRYPGALTATYFPATYQRQERSASAGPDSWSVTEMARPPGAREAIMKMPGNPPLGARYVRIEQRRGLRQFPAGLEIAGVLSVRGTTAYIERTPEVTAIAWAEGDVVVKVSSNAVGVEELLLVAEGLTSAP